MLEEEMAEKVFNFFIPYFGTPVIDREKAIKIVFDRLMHYVNPNDWEIVEESSKKDAALIVSALLSANIFK